MPTEFLSSPQTSEESYISTRPTRRVSAIGAHCELLGLFRNNTCYLSCHAKRNATVSYLCDIYIYVSYNIRRFTASRIPYLRRIISSSNVQFNVYTIYTIYVYYAMVCVIMICRYVSLREQNEVGIYFSRFTKVFPNVTENCKTISMKTVNYSRNYWNVHKS